MPSSPSAVRVFAKSLHILAAAWLASVAMLWVAELRQDARLNPGAPQDPHVSTLIEGLVPALVLELSALALDRWASTRGPSSARQEWVQALWWSLLPLVLLAETVYLMIWPDG